MKPFRVLQFNMQFGQRWDDLDPDHAPVDLQGTIDEIVRHDADVILLQEVERALPNGVQPEPPPNFGHLRQVLRDYDSSFAYPRPDHRELPFGIGLAIFTRTPLRDTFRDDLPSPPIPFEFAGETRTPTDRLLIGAKTTIHGREVTLMNTHLLAFFMLKSTSEVHGDQRSRVAQRLQRAQGPTLLAGDFNVSQHTSLIGQFAEAGFATVQQEEVTWRRRPYVLDHVFYNRFLRCVAFSVIPTPASDHHALVADFIFAD
ncbi:MAG TPA: endonuclease/exonuclease/phosphatase family protein [Candidatus Synoicihabitans sp.]|nr:endonuclease/exonuclease/phosphatase family protein [Candidatus Synoicihabitans sp.]